MTCVCAVDFGDSAAVAELAGKDERLVCLELSDASLYCHSTLLSFASPVLRHVLEDTQQEQGQLCTIPLKDEEMDASVWHLALGLIYRLESAVITSSSAQALLLLAHKYDMRHATAEVTRFLRSDAAKGHLSPSTVNGWLQAVSKCSLEQQVQACIDYIILHNLPVTMELLTSLHADHADKLLAAKQRQCDALRSDKLALDSRVVRSSLAVDRAIDGLGGGYLYVYTCSAGCPGTFGVVPAQTGLSCPRCGRKNVLRADISPLSVYDFKP